MSRGGAVWQVGWWSALVGISLLFAVGVASPARAAAGDLDPGFGTGGVVTARLGGENSAEAIALQTDGKLVVAGRHFDSLRPEPYAELLVARYNVDGSVDSAFSGDGYVLVDVPGVEQDLVGVAVQADGRIVVAGNVDDATTGSRRAFLVRFTPGGAVDTSFGTGGSIVVNLSLLAGSDADVRAMAIQPDGQVVLAVYTLSSSGGLDVTLVRYTSTGALDAAFGTGGRVSTDVGDTDTPEKVLIQSDGRFVVVGSTYDFSSPAGMSDLLMLRYSPAGVLDASFGAGGRVTAPLGSDAVVDAVLQPDGKIGVIAWSSPTTTPARTVVSRYTSTGAIDVSFGTSGRATFQAGIPSAAAVHPDGSIVVVALDTAAYRPAVIRLLTDGAADPSFGSNGIASPNLGVEISPLGVAVQSDGKIVVVGPVTNPPDLGIVRYQGAGPLGTFIDDDDSIHQPNIEAIADAGITAGCDVVGPRYCPDAPVTRGQMAIFLLRALGLTSPQANTFVDDDGSIYEAAIEAISEAGITAGCDVVGPRYCPDRAVTRGEMATFLARGLGLTPVSPAS